MKHLSFPTLLALILCLGQIAPLVASAGLGFSSFLDGGPLRPQAGWYWLEYWQSYHANKFIDYQGNTIGGSQSPHFTSEQLITQFVYQFEQPLIPRALGGINVALPLTLYSHVASNPFAISSSGAGPGNLLIGFFAQFKPIMKENGDPFFVHRLELDIGFPTAKNKEPSDLINPGFRAYLIRPYWAFSLYFTPRFATSWRFNYLWASKNHKANLQLGDSFNVHYSIEHALSRHLWVGLSGYYLQQLHDTTFQDTPVLHSKVRVASIGFGGLYFFGHEPNFVLIGNLYFEFDARNKAQGTNLVFRLLKQF